MIKGKIHNHRVYILSLALVVCLLPEMVWSQSKIIAFGDSLTEGCDNKYTECGMAGGYGYENVLQTLFTNAGRDVTVTNFGWGGETTAEGVNRIDSVLNDPCNQGADYILILEGTNDLLHGADGMTVKFNLGVMVDKSRAYGVEPLLATITPDPDPDRSYKNIPLMNEYIRQLAQEKKVVLVDQYGALSPDWTSYTSPRGCYGDLLHPNLSGFQAMGSVWYDSLSNLPVLTEDNQANAGSAEVYGSADGTNGPISGLVFEYGKDCLMDKRVQASPSMVDGTEKVSVTARIDGLQSESTYCYRLISIENGILVHNGGTYSFTTRQPSMPWLKLLLAAP